MDLLESDCGMHKDTDVSNNNEDRWCWNRQVTGVQALWEHCVYTLVCSGF